MNEAPGFRAAAVGEVDPPVGGGSHCVAEFVRIPSSHELGYERGHESSVGFLPGFVLS